MKTKSKVSLVVMLVLAIVTSLVAQMGIGESGILGVESIKLGLDLSGGVSIVYQAEKDDVTDEEMATAVAIIQRRLDRKGWTEGEASRQGENRIMVEIPGIDDVDDAVNELGRTSQLIFATEDGTIVLTGEDVANAKRQVGQTSQNSMAESYVSLEFTDKGRQLFASATAANIGKMILIIMDDEVISAPRVNSAITDGSAMITGDFTGEEADELAIQIKEGSIPFNLTVMEMNNVGARLGSDAIQTSLFAACVGIALVLIFMLIWYRGCGLAANWALIIYIGLEIIALSALNVTLTLSGIAGIILSVGMAVDANVIIFERIKEEIKSGKSLNASLKAGFSRALPAILDGNITTFIAGIVLYWMGTGTIRGFAQTLMIGIVISMFTAIFVTRTILQGFVACGIKSPSFFGVKEVKEGGDVHEI